VMVDKPVAFQGKRDQGRDHHGFREGPGVSVRIGAEIRTGSGHDKSRDALENAKEYIREKNRYSRAILEKRRRRTRTNSQAVVAYHKMCLRSVPTSPRIISEDGLLVQLRARKAIWFWKSGARHCQRHSGQDRRENQEQGCFFHPPSFAYIKFKAARTSPDTRLRRFCALLVHCA